MQARHDPRRVSKALSIFARYPDRRPERLSTSEDGHSLDVDSIWRVWGRHHPSKTCFTTSRGTPSETAGRGVSCSRATSRLESGLRQPPLAPDVNHAILDSIIDDICRTCILWPLEPVLSHSPHSTKSCRWPTVGRAPCPRTPTMTRIGTSRQKLISPPLRTPQSKTKTAR